MRVVVMDEEMREPITVVEIPIYLIREIERQGRAPFINLAAPTRMESWFTMLDKGPERPRAGDNQTRPTEDGANLQGA